MVIEYIRYTVPSARAEDFERAYQAAAGVLDDDPHCLGYEIARGVEEPEHYTVRIEWDSVEGHEQSFRRSARFGEFFAAVKPFFPLIQEMKHYTTRFGASR
ncbi:antibiotic biosynthesis monooxygenase family protein [Nonomuraea basaltis]|uniref:antibiotic biosynthesis monooxygenase family protein n=1 Tax=Nonomuraea basaltis TaxID=2495887 RepID=UPI00110C5830|nr:antibiotic biosynthesis monooxygenase family protein [Nonomuraea basaltis]TMR90655.1 antibiotic biosynthesis monooxygenase [Nonomuraea basaltis]